MMAYEPSRDDCSPGNGYLDYDGTRVFYEYEGTGADAIVLLHGGGPGASSRSNFEYNLPALGRHFRLILIDLPGYGHSGPATQAARESAFAYYARVVAAVLDELGYDRVSLIGNSLGGGVAFRFADMFPARASRLVLLGPAGVCYPIFSPSGRIHSALGERSSAVLRNPTPETMRAFLDEMVYDRSMITDAVIAERLEALASLNDREDPGSPIFSMWLEAKDRVVKFNPADFESWRDCHRVSTPTLLIWGRDDHFNPVDGALYPLRYMPNAQLHIFGRCGHWAQVEHWRDFDAAVLAFLQADVSAGRDKARPARGRPAGDVAAEDAHA
jgi:4,5:9,10-diseco-3-hydroxy-5,9,17-trioxoandrosta-1(10),2-diene-4-oate hydrolase